MTAATHDAPASRALSASFADVRLLRVGSRFTVFAAREADGRPVVVKVPDENGPSWVHDLLRTQGELLTRVGDHPHVVSLRGTLTLPDGRPALVLDRCAAVLDEVAAGGGAFALPRVLALGIQLADALDHVHTAEVLHGDVRPANVLLTDAVAPVLAGFDEAVSVRPGADRVPQHVVTAYTAPELLEGADPVPASDVYGLAATLYDLLAGHPPFRQYEGESAATVIVRVLSGQVPPVVAPEVPLEVSDLVTWGLAADPAGRPPSPAWLREELRRLESRFDLPPTRVRPPD